jgi:hypothetical protein
VEVKITKRPTTRLVVVDDATGSPVIELHEEFAGDDVDIATQLHDTSNAVGSRLQGLAVDRVVVRRADHGPSSNKEGPRLRLLTEGAILTAARAVMVDTQLGTGRDLGSWHGTDKAGVDAAGAALAASSGVPKAFAGATAAALGGLAKP